MVDIVTGLRQGRPGVHIPVLERKFLFFKMLRTALNPTQPLMQRVLRFFPSYRGPGRQLVFIY
jgi:hypothetical protein